jgi:hypothetical protein
MFSRPAGRAAHAGSWEPPPEGTAQVQTRTYRVVVNDGVAIPCHDHALVCGPAGTRAGGGHTSMRQLARHACQRGLAHSHQRTARVASCRPLRSAGRRRRHALPMVEPVALQHSAGMPKAVACRRYPSATCCGPAPPAAPHMRRCEQREPQHAPAGCCERTRLALHVVLHYVVASGNHDLLAGRNRVIRHGVVAPAGHDEASERATA